MFASARAVVAAVRVVVAVRGRHTWYTVRRDPPSLRNVGVNQYLRRHCTMYSSSRPNNVSTTAQFGMPTGVLHVTPNKVDILSYPPSVPSPADTNVKA